MPTEDAQVVVNAYGGRTASAVSGIARIRRQTLDDIPRRSARRFPSRIAIIDGATRLTFTEFDAAVDRVAAALAHQGMAKGDRMALLAHNCWQYPVLAFAAARIGAVLGDDDPMRIMYTSGTESRPKGALLSSRSLMWQYMSCIAAGEMSERDIEIHPMPLYHCAQLDNFLITDLYLGATSVILCRPDPVLILRAIERERATNLFCPPTVWIELLGNPELAERDVSTLRKGYYGASAMPASVLRDIRERFPNLRLWNFYGQTEMASLATALRPDDQDEFAGSAGYPVANVDTRIVGLDGNDVPAGTVGEIVHRSPQLILGYYRDPARTAEAFRDGWFHSGDFGRFDDERRLYVVDRLKDVIKSGGENVSGREVEEVLYQHDAVSEAAVFGVRDPRWIEAVAAVVVPRTGHTVTSQELIAHCRTQLAGFKVPKYIVLTDSLPKNPSGKILKRELRAAHADIAKST